MEVDEGRSEACEGSVDVNTEEREKKREKRFGLYESDQKEKIRFLKDYKPAVTFKKPDLVFPEEAAQ